MLQQLGGQKSKQWLQWKLASQYSWTNTSQYTDKREHVLHVVHELLPPQSVASQNYNLRPRKHHFELPNRTSHLTDCNFMQRILFLETYWRSILSCYFHFISHPHILLNIVLSAFWQSLIKHMIMMMMMIISVMRNLNQRSQSTGIQHGKAARHYPPRVFPCSLINCPSIADIAEWIPHSEL